MSNQSYLPDDVLVGNVERKAIREYEIFRRLEKTGLWNVNISMLPAPIFRIVVNIPGKAVDKYGHRSDRDNFFFCVCYPRLLHRDRPARVWPGDADLPDSPDFRRYPIFYSSLTIERHLWHLFRSVFRGKREMRDRPFGADQDFPAVTLALDVCGALDSSLTQRKLAEAGLSHLTGVIARKKFEIKERGAEVEFRRKPEPKFVVKSTAAADGNGNTSISAIAGLGSRIDTLSRSTPNVAPLYIDRQALQTIKEHIQWGRSVAENRVEQGGFLIGQSVQTPRQERTAIITLALPARGTRGSNAYVRFDHTIWKRMYDEYDNLVRTGAIMRTQTVIGWYHTHPNMNIFMSGTDMGTQRSLFNRDGNFALVFNPQSKLCGCFRGADAAPTPLVEADVRQRSLSPDKPFQK